MPSIRTSIFVVLLLVAGASRAFAEDLRTDGTRIFDERLARLGEMAREHDDLEDRIRESCLAVTTVNTRSGEVAGALSPICQGLRAESSRLEASLRDGIARAKADARRTGVYPGTVRTGIRRERLEAFDD
jgi:hypothetical protein